MTNTGRRPKDEWLLQLNWHGRVADEAATWPLIHRTHRPTDRTLESILGSNRIELRPVGTSLEASRGYAEAAYAFLGVASYPKGLVALCLDPAVTSTLPCTFTPFDTGGVEAGHLKSSHSADELFDRWLGEGQGMLEVAPSWVASLYDSASDYLRSVGGLPRPNRSPATGIDTEGRDARAWAIEVQLHESLDLDRFLNFVVTTPDLARSLPETWDVHLAEDASEDALGAAVARHLTREHDE
ncbi:MAG: hypothetical protein IV100_30440 [Myxococcales bacterium]|nr:hypothetical protein [Myxococcales bacterium]